MHKLEIWLENFLFASRWIMSIFFVGLVLTLVLMAVKFLQELWHIIPDFLSISGEGVILAILSLVDLTMTASLILMVILAGYENFVSKIRSGEHEDRPEWMGHVDFSGLKLKLLASIVAISAIQLLKVFMNPGAYDNTRMAWMVGIHVTFVVSGVLLAYMDRLHSSSGRHK